MRIPIGFSSVTCALALALVLGGCLGGGADDDARQSDEVTIVQPGAPGDQSRQLTAA